MLYIFSEKAKNISRISYLDNAIKLIWKITEAIIRIHGENLYTLPKVPEYDKKCAVSVQWSIRSPISKIRQENTEIRIIKEGKTIWNWLKAIPNYILPIKENFKKQEECS